MLLVEVVVVLLVDGVVVLLGDKVGFELAVLLVDGVVLLMLGLLDDVLVAEFD